MNTKLLKKVLASTLALSMVLPIGVVNADKQNTQQEKSQQTTRISGKDRIITSVEISKSAYTTSENVVLASGFNFADALSAGQLASALNAPLLLSSQNKLDSQTKNEIERLKAKKVYVVGGDNAISKTGIDTTLKSEKIDVTRLEGQDRYSTSQKVMEKTKEIINPEYLLIASGKNFPDALAALEIAKLSFDKNNNAILASGQVFADSLSAVSLTKKHNAPIILTQSDSLTENAKKYLNGKNVFIVGGEKTVVKDILTRKKPAASEKPKNLHNKTGQYYSSLISSKLSKKQAKESNQAYKVSINGDYLVVSGYISYNNDPNELDSGKSIGHSVNHSFKITDKTVFRAVSGLARPSYFNKTEFLNYYKLCKNTGLALVITVENGVATKVEIAS